MTSALSTSELDGSSNLLARARERWTRVDRPVPADRRVCANHRLRFRTVAIDVVVAWMIIAVVLAWLLRPWDLSLRSPFAYGGDGLFYAMNVKSILQGGWMQETARLGAPFGQELYDFPIGGDNGNYLLIKGIGLFSGDWALVMNVFYLLQFFTTALTSYVCARTLGVGRRSCVVIAVLYSLAPFHFLRLGHLMLAHYAVLPLGVLLALRAADGLSLRSPAGSRRSVLLWLAVCACVGSFGAYWGIFSLMTIACAAVLAAAVHRTVRPLVAAIIVGGVTSTVMVANQLGTLLYRREHGPNSQVARRSPIEIDMFGLRPIQLITPAPGTRLGFLRGMGRTLSAGYESEPSMHLGVVLAAVFCTMLVWLATGAIRPTGRETAPIARLLAVLTVIWLLVATTGGFDWLVRLVSFDRVRGWNRASILIAFMVALWGAFVVVPWIARVAERLQLAKVWLSVLAAAVIVVGVVDQTGRGNLPARDWYDYVHRSDRDFFVGIEADLPTGAMVFQLPVRRFPEDIPTHMSGDYDLLRPYIATEDLRWSYGGMKFREAEWQQLLASAPADDLLDDLVAAGFQGLLIDRFGYADNGADLESSLTALTGQQPRVSTDGRWAYVPVLRALSSLSDAALAARRQWLFSTPMLSLDTGCWGWERSDDGPFGWCGASGTFIAVVPEPSSEPSTMRLAVEAPTGPASITLSGEGVDITAPIGVERSVIEVPVAAGQQYVPIDFTTDAAAVVVPGDARRLNVQIRQVTPDVPPG
jgi:phosphoglycerol transferase